MQALDVATMVALLTAIVSLRVAFLPDGSYTVLVVSNWIIVFTTALVSSFFVPVASRLMGGAVKDHKKIAWRYLTTWFIFDLLATRRSTSSRRGPARRPPTTRTPTPRARRAGARLVHSSG